MVPVGADRSIPKWNPLPFRYPIPDFGKKYRRGEERNGSGATPGVLHWVSSGGTAELQPDAAPFTERGRRELDLDQARQRDPPPFGSQDPASGRVAGPDSRSAVRATGGDRGLGARRAGAEDRKTQGQEESTHQGLRC